MDVASPTRAPEAGCSPSRFTHNPLSASQNRTVPSRLAEASKLPAGLVATCTTAASWPTNVLTTLRLLPLLPVP